MNCTAVERNHTPDADSQGCPVKALLGRRFFPVVGLFILLIWCSAAALAENASQPTNSTTPLSIHATHLLGFEGAKSNSSGTLSIQDNALQFQKNGTPAVQIKIVSIHDVFLGEQSKQVGGTPVTMGKVAAPFGGGRVVSLFAHKKYDTLTLEYVDAEGGIHGAIFQLDKGQGEVMGNELASRGVHVSPGEDEPTKQNTAEVTGENK